MASPNRPPTLPILFFTNNSVDGSGGAYYGHGHTEFLNTTFIYNSAGDGGAIYLWGTANITANTIVFNQATNEGGGLFSWGDISLEQSIVANNTAETKPEMGFHFAADFVSRGYNLIGYSYSLNLRATDIISDDPGILGFDGTTILLNQVRPPPSMLFPVRNVPLSLTNDLLNVPKDQVVRLGAVEMRQDDAGTLLDIAEESEIVSDKFVSVTCSEDALRNALRTHAKLDLARGLRL